MIFFPNCTLPSHTVNYVASANVRGTLDILWSSLATLVACTYTVLHLSVPEQRPPRKRGFKETLKSNILDFGKTSGWALFNLLVPELVLLKAGQDWYSARRELRKLHAAVPELRETYTIVHMFFADMGGFVVGYNPKPTEQSELAAKGNSSSNTGALEETTSPASDAREVDLFYFRADTLRAALERGLFSNRPVSTDEILNKAKSDAFAKVLTMAQIVYYVVEVITRACQGLTISPLELGVTAFVACSTATYAFFFSKPKSVSEVIKLGVFEGDLPSWLRDMRSDKKAFLALDSIPSGSPADNSEFLKSLTDRTLVVLMPAISIPFGAVHLAGWNLTFPTSVDQWLWRSASIATTTTYVLYLLLAFAIHLIEDGPWARLQALWGNSAFVKRALYYIIEWQMGAIVFGAPILYTIARLIIIVEMFRCLFFLPPGAFTTTWPNNIPHIG